MSGYIVGHKAICQYLGCSPSTLKRWIRTEGLPVWRLGPGTKGRVGTTATALERWLQQRPSASAAPPNGNL